MKGTGAVPGIKRLSKNNPIREISNIRDGNDGYRLGRLPVLINMTEAKSSRSRSTSRSRSNSARRASSRSNSRGRKKASPSPKRSSPVKSVLKVQEVEPKPVESELPERQDLGEISEKINSLLHKSSELYNQMNVISSQTSTMTSIPPVPRLNITSSFTDLNKENRTPNIPNPSRNFQYTQPIRPQSYQSTNSSNGLPSSLGQARNLPQLTLNIPELPNFNNRQPEPQNYSQTFSSQNAYQNLRPTIEPHEEFNSSLHSVDYVPSEASLLDQDILESIYTMNGGGERVRPERKISEEPVREEPSYWLRKGDRLNVHVLEVELPQRKGRPPPSTTMRRIDDTFCLDFDFKWTQGGVSSYCIIKLILRS